jgi:hypothetical protein
MTDEFSTCPGCGQGVLVSQITVDSECIENNYSCGHKLDRIYVSVKTLVTAEIKTKSHGGAFIGKKKREYEIGSSLFCVDILTKTNAVKLKNHLIHRE